MDPYFPFPLLLLLDLEAPYIVIFDFNNDETINEISKEVKFMKNQVVGDLGAIKKHLRIKNKEQLGKI